MKIHFGGVRGTSAVAGDPDFDRFGGDTTSLLIEGAGGATIVVDAGTGIMNISRRLAGTANSRSLLLLLTHYHLDHLMGLPSFAQLYDSSWHIEIAAPATAGPSAREAVTRILEQPFWPLQIDTMAAQVSFAELIGSDSAHNWAGLAVRWCALHHPGGCTAYRIDEPTHGAAVVFATDLEWAESSDEEKGSLRELCRQPTPAQILICDGQFRQGEYARYRGWGHSTVEDAVELAGATGIGRLLVTHHAPDQDDRMLADL